MPADELTQLADFLVRLRARYQSLTLSAADDPLQLCYTLSLSVAALQDLSFYAANPECRVPQVVVMGPTQVGKSTVVNLLLQCEAAQPSPLAGFTRNLQGFSMNVTDACRAALHSLLNGSVEGADQVSLQAVQSDPDGPVVIWDTPDFDSHASRDYRHLLPRVAGMADLLLLVLSKEKYADLSVWTTLELVKPLQTPLVACLNKTDRWEDLMAPLHEHIAQSGFESARVAVCHLPYMDMGGYAELNATQAAAELRQAVAKLTRLRDQGDRAGGVDRLLRRYWDDWVAPVREELSSAETWQRDVDEVLVLALSGYRDQYLSHARYENTFNRAVLRLLELLEIPGIAGAMSQVRRVLTWPLRRLRGLRESRRSLSGEDAETEVLVELFDHSWLALERRINDRLGDDHAGRWWRAMREAMPPVDVARSEYLAAVVEYQEAFHPVVAQAGEQLYERLKENPLTLNALRAGRVGADAAGVVLALNTGTVGVSEAVLTPAMLSLTSMLAESAVGKYLDTVREGLRQAQNQQVQKVLDERLRGPLLSVPEQIDDAGIFNIGADELAAAEAARRALT